MKDGVKITVLIDKANPACRIFANTKQVTVLLLLSLVYWAMVKPVPVFAAHKGSESDVAYPAETSLVRIPKNIAVLDSSIKVGVRLYLLKLERLKVSGPVLWFFFGFLNIAAAACVVAAFAIFVSFDRWRQGWFWGTLRCIAIPACISVGWHLIWYALSLVGA
jgi:hypothetical protein